jgi:hypothetical protein
MARSRSATYNASQAGSGGSLSHPDTGFLLSTADDTVGAELPARPAGRGAEEWSVENVRGHTLGPNGDQNGRLFKTSHPTARKMRVLVADTFVMAATTCVDAPPEGLAPVLDP